ncbi:MAG TPA: phospholipase D-like domain-containing protein [Polyangiaceae bacterium]|nr:phospholipase D-like domain-containing protein [Polyangiaceae bacterium]
MSTFNLGHKAKEGEAKGNPVLLPLAKRMAEKSSLTVRVFVNLRRIEHMAHASEREVEDAFVGWFRKEIWPWELVPEVYYDPRSLQAFGEESACLHAKCVVVDDERAFVTSANLTEAAHGRNIEAGVLMEDPIFSRTLRMQFESLIDRGYVRRLTRGMGA